MVDKKISDICYPKTVKIGKNMKDGNLILNVVHGKEMQVEYERKEIMDKINSFFGYNCISNITLKIVHEKIENKKKFFPKFQNISEIKEKIKKVENIELKSSLSNFLKAFNERNK